MVGPAALFAVDARLPSQDGVFVRIVPRTVLGIRQNFVGLLELRKEYGLILNIVQIAIRMAF